MKLGDILPVNAKAVIGLHCRGLLDEEIPLGRAHVRVKHSRPKDWVRDAKTGLLVPDTRWKFDAYAKAMAPDPDSVDLLLEDESWNLITNAGRIFLHKQGYDTTGLGANGLNYIALSNDTLTETAASTTLSTEIAANGLARAQGTVTLPTGSGNVTTVDKTFTCATAPQAAQKAALFTASSVGTMNHVLAFTQRSLQIADTLQVTFSITLG